MSQRGFDIVQSILMERSEALKEARGIIEVEKNDRRPLTSTEVRKYDELMLRADELKDEADEAKKKYNLEGVFEGKFTLGIDGSSLGNDDGTDERNKPHASDEYRKAFWNVMKSDRNMPHNQEDVNYVQSPEARSMAIATNQGGGVLVPLHVEKDLVRKLTEANVMRQISQVLALEPGDRRIPIVADDGEAAWLGEGVEYPSSGVKMDQILLGGYKMGRIAQVSEELLHDSVVSIEDMVTDSFVKSFAELEEEAFINGNGTTEPTGVLDRAELGFTGSSETEITADELYEIFYSLKRPYRQRAVWLLNDHTIKIIRQLKTADGQYIWQPGFGDEPDKLLGRPVFTSPSMPLMASGSRSILFGDFTYYKIADRQGWAMQRLDEMYATYGRIGLRAFQRVDGNLAIPEAIKAFENAIA